LKDPTKVQEIKDTSYADVFIDGMNFYEFDQADFINPDEQIDYMAYLKNIEKTLSEKSKY
tara:strand:+ start:186 stop:365 length:180 start_codon:yes stop_codon:yes gene_type:complete